MPTIRHEEYDIDGTLLAVEEIEVPEAPDVAADREFREAVEAATSVADLKAVLLGANGPGAEPRRPARN